METPRSSRNKSASSSAGSVGMEIIVSQEVFKYLRDLDPFPSPERWKLVAKAFLACS